MADLCTGGIAWANHFNGASQNADKAFDNNFTTTKWVASNSDFPVDVWIVNQLSGGAATVVSVQLTSGNDLPVRDPVDFFIAGSNDGSTWTTLLGVRGATWSDRNVTNTYDFANSVPYAYYRFYCVKTNALNGETTIVFQLSEIKYWTGPSGTGTNVALGGTITASGENPGAGEGKDKAFDNNTTTKWLVPVANPLSATRTRGWWIGYELPTAAAVNKYTITSGNDAAERDPQDWRFEGSNDGCTWTTADTRTGEDFVNRLQTNTYTFTNTIGAKKFWMLHTTIKGDGSTIFTFQIEEIEMEAVGGADTLTASGLTNTAPVFGPAPLMVNVTAAALSNTAPVLGAPALVAAAAEPLTLYDYTLDFGLEALLLTNKIVVCSQKPATYAEANATYKIGEKTFASATPWTWDAAKKSADITLSSGDLVTTGTSSSDSNVLGTVGASSGKYYWEIVATNVDSITNFYGVGIGNANVTLDGWPGSSAADGVVTYRQITSWDIAGANNVGTAPGFTTGDRLGFAWDADNELVWITKNGTTWYGSTSAGNPASGTGGLSYAALDPGPYFPLIGQGNLDVATLVPAAANWVYSAPSGFTQLGGGGSVVTAGPQDATPTGRQIVTAAVVGGTVTSNGTPTHWAIVDDANSRLLAAGNMTGSEAVTTADGWTLDAMTINVP